jgi:hypothetical protein
MYRTIGREAAGPWQEALFGFGVVVQPFGTLRRSAVIEHEADYCADFKTIWPNGQIECAGCG